MMKKRSIFIIFFLIVSVYLLLIRTELYESETSLIVRDLSSNTPSSSFAMSLLGAASGSQAQDSLVVQEYIWSRDMFDILDKEFHLTQHYKSKDFDLLQRVWPNATAEDVLAYYQNRMKVFYDEPSGILHVAYSDTDPAMVKELLTFLVKHVEHQYNEFNKRKVEKQLKFIEQEYKNAKAQMDQSSKKLEEYQNTHLLLDPTSQATSSSGIIANLQAALTQKNIELASMKTYLNDSSYEVSSLQNEIKEIKKSIVNEKKSLAGNDGAKLNTVMFGFEKLKLQLEFDTEVYKNALLQLESTKLDLLKDAKTLSILNSPTLPDGYRYPEKLKDFITLVILFLLSYGIFSMLGAIIKDHKE